MSEKPQRKPLPERPSLEHLRKQAKQLVKDTPGLQLAAAQHQLAQDYGFRNWATMIETVALFSPSQRPLQARLAEANLLAKAGKNTEALECFLECLDLALELGSKAGIDSPLILAGLFSLGKSYPPAKASLRERRQQISRVAQIKSPLIGLLNAEEQAVDERFRRAQQLIWQKDKAAEALSELLWCYDVGMKGSESHRGTRRSFLLGAVARIGADHPPALRALQERREEIRKRWRNDPEEWQDFVAITRVLKDGPYALGFYDELKNSGSALPNARGLFDHFLAARRYADALAAVPLESYQERFETLVKDLAASPEEPYAIGVGNLARIAAQQSEALAGVGDLISARSVVERMLKIDRSEATLSVLRVHATRVGHPELVPTA